MYKPGLFHHSRLLSCRKPQGALRTGENVCLRLYAEETYAHATATLLLQTDGGRRRIPMHAEASARGIVFTTSFCAPRQTGLCWYSFSLDCADGTTCCYGAGSCHDSDYRNDGDHRYGGGEGQLFTDCHNDGHPPAYQITVYDPAFTTPGWFREGVIYQIFPDRFARGRAENPGVAYHRHMGRQVRLHEHWDETPFFLPEANEENYVPNDFFLGDLAGIRQKLPYLQSLGITCLYLNPVFESYSNHRYDTADYLQIDPVLGTNEEFAALTEACKAQGIRIMLDGVFSHTGADSRYFNKYARYPEAGAYQTAQSPYRAWYEFDEKHPAGYRAWWGFPELPEVNETEPGYLEFVMNGEHALLDHWATHGATSWRLDVADELPDTFIQALRKKLKAIDPDAVLLGEVWEDASRKEAYGALRSYVQGHALDSVMNYPFKDAALAFFTGEHNAHALNDFLQTQRERYPQPFYYAAMNLLSSHDCERALTRLGGAPDARTLTREQEAAFCLTEEQQRLAKRRLVAAMALAVALPGVPCLYYGDEAGLFAMSDPFNRGTYPWGREDTALLTAMRALTTARSGSPALRSGFCRMGAVSAEVFAVLRYTANGTDAFGEPQSDDAVLLLVNRSTLPVHVRLRLDRLPEDFSEGPDAETPCALSGVWRNTLSGETYRVGDAFEAVLPSVSATLLKRQ